VNSCNLSIGCSTIKKRWLSNIAQNYVTILLLFLHPVSKHFCFYLQSTVSHFVCLFHNIEALQKARHYLKFIRGRRDLWFFPRNSDSKIQKSMYFLGNSPATPLCNFNYIIERHAIWYTRPTFPNVNAITLKRYWSRVDR